MKTSQIAINTVSTAHPSLEEVLSAYADAGFTNIEWCLPHAKGWLAKGHSVDDLANLLDSNGQRSVGGFEAGVVAFGSAEEKKANHQLLVDNTKLLGQLGGGIMVVGTDGPPAGQPATVESLDTIGKTLGHLVERMDPSVTLAVEFNWSPIVKSLRSVRRVVDAADHPRVGILFDPAHYHCTSCKLEDLDKKTVKKIAHLHVNDMSDKPGELSNCNADRVLPGEGTLDLVELLGRIEKHGYKGLFSIEMFNEELWKKPVGEAAKLCYKSMKKLGKKLQELIVIELHVSPAGNDGGAGTVDAPLRTLEGARDAIRRLKSVKKLDAPVRVLLRAGTHWLDRPFVLTPADSGTRRAPITYAAHPGERPIVSGGQAITDWRVTEHNGKPAWVADLPDVAAERWSFTQLFVNGRRAPRTRLPKTGFHRFAALPDLPPGNPWDHIWSGATRATITPSDIVPEWKNLGDVDIIAIQHWFEGHFKVGTLDPQTNILTFKCPAQSSLNDEKNSAARYCVENVFEALDEPGQWYLDRPAGKLYYLPLASETPENSVVIAPKLDYLVRLDGDPEVGGKKVKFVRFEHLDFRHAEWSLPHSNPGAVQASFTVPGAIALRGAEDCALYGCSISQVAQYAVEIRRGCTRNRIVACAMFDLGGGGVKVNHELPYRGDSHTASGAFAGMDPIDMGWDSADPAKAFANAERTPPMRTTISDCTIHTGGRIFLGAIGIWIGDAAGNRVRHNHVFDFLYTAVSLGWVWGYNATRAGDNRVEFNHLHDIGQGMLSDMGAIYTLGAQPGTILRNNLIHDITAYGYGGWGIYNDEGSAGILIENNIVYRGKSNAYFLHYGRDQIIRNNILALAGGASAFPSDGAGAGWTREEASRPFTFERNIVYAIGTSAVHGANPRASLDHNLYFQAHGRPLVFNGHPLEKWRAEGYDQRSVVADPLFVDPLGGDFTLRPDSPALALGFVPIDASTIGPRFRDSGGMLPATIDQWREPREAPAVIVEARLEAMDSATFAQLMAEQKHPGIPKVMPLDPDKSQPISVQVRNTGALRAGGEIDLTLVPPDAGFFEGGTMLHFDLEPGQSASLDARFVMHAGIKKVRVETRARGDVFTSSTLDFEVTDGAR